MNFQNNSVIPAHAGTQLQSHSSLGPRMRGDDENIWGGQML